MFHVFVLIWLGFFAGAAEQQDSRKADWFKISPEEFAKLEQPKQPLDTNRLNHELLSAAVWHETNRRRREHELERLEHSPAADRAADFQARAMAKDRFVSHSNPEPGHETLEDRLRAAKIKPRFAAENVAMTFAIKYKSGEPVYPREENGPTLFSYEPGGPPIPPHSYASFAETLVQEWMASPGHRKNILDARARRFGFSARPASSEIGMDVLYSVQVFYTPL
jgi:uncharacterized protein YkwD